MNKELKALNILSLPIYRDFKNNEPFSASGLLVEAIYNDNSKDYLLNPYIVIPQFIKTDTYEVKIFKSKNEMKVYTSYFVNYRKDVIEKEIKTIKGTFKSFQSIIEYEKGKAIRCNKKDDYNEEVVNKVLDYAKTNNIDVVWEEIK